MFTHLKLWFVGWKFKLALIASAILNLIKISKVSLYYINALAIMKDFWNNEKKQLKMAASRPFLFYAWKICHGLSLGETLHFVLYSWSHYLAFFSI